MPKKILLISIKFYKATISIVLRSFFGTGCRFEPTCSEYAHQAISTRGVIMGLLLSIKRILRCHPWSKGGYDPVLK